MSCAGSQRFFSFRRTMDVQRVSNAPTGSRGHRFAVQSELCTGFITPLHCGSEVETTATVRWSSPDHFPEKGLPIGRSYGLIGNPSADCRHRAALAARPQREPSLPRRRCIMALNLNAKRNLADVKGLKVDAKAMGIDVRKCIPSHVCWYPQVLQHGEERGMRESTTHTPFTPGSPTASASAGTSARRSSIRTAQRMRLGMRCGLAVRSPLG